MLPNKPSFIPPPSIGSRCDSSINNDLGISNTGLSVISKPMFAIPPPLSPPLVPQTMTSIDYSVPKSSEMTSNEIYPTSSISTIPIVKINTSNSNIESFHISGPSPIPQQHPIDVLQQSAMKLNHVSNNIGKTTSNNSGTEYIGSGSLLKLASSTSGASIYFEPGTLPPPKPSKKVSLNQDGIVLIESTASSMKLKSATGDNNHQHDTTGNVIVHDNIIRMGHGLRTKQNGYEANYNLTLTEDFFIYYEPDEITSFIKSKQPQRTISTRAMAILPDDNGNPCILRFYSKVKSFYIKFASPDEMLGWYNDLNTVTRRVQMKDNGVMISEIDCLPIFARKIDTVNCQQCCKVFGILDTKNHCRNCGKCVCEGELTKYTFTHTYIILPLVYLFVLSIYIY